MVYFFIGNTIGIRTDNLLVSSYYICFVLSLHPVSNAVAK